MWLKITKRGSALDLKQQWNERLNLEYLCRLLHQDVVVLEPGLDQVSPFQRRVSARHRNDLGFLDQQVARPVAATSQQLKRSEFLHAVK